MAKPKLPQEIYVVARREDRLSWLEADGDILGFEHGDEVGVYRLVRTARKAVTHSLEKP